MINNPSNSNSIPRLKRRVWFLFAVLAFNTSPIHAKAPEQFRAKAIFSRCDKISFKKLAQDIEALKSVARSRYNEMNTKKRQDTLSSTSELGQVVSVLFPQFVQPPNYTVHSDCTGDSEKVLRAIDDLAQSSKISANMLVEFESAVKGFRTCHLATGRGELPELSMTMITCFGQIADRLNNSKSTDKSLVQ
jgi:hypothetical protein